PEFGGHPLVGIDFEDPLAAARVDAGMAAGPLPLPGPFDKAVGGPQRDLARAVAAAVKHDDDFIGDVEARKAIGELVFLVMCDDQGRKPWLAHAAALATERHSRMAAASAASIESPSIRVSVVRWSKPGVNIVSGGSAQRTQAAWRPHGAYCAAGLGPNSPSVGVPAAAAMCMSPVSLPMNIAQRRSTATAVSSSVRPTRSIRRYGGERARHAPPPRRPVWSPPSATTQH